VNDAANSCFEPNVTSFGNAANVCFEEMWRVMENLNSKLTIQQMLNELSDHSVRVSDITAWLETNNGGNLEGHFWELNDELCEGILAERWEPMTDLEKFRRLFDVIELWPSYSTSTYLYRLQKDGVDVQAEAFLCQQMVHALEYGGMLHREAIEYVLWVDFFEDRTVSAKIWHGLMTLDPIQKVKECLLLNSGPVPYSEKRGHYKKLFEDPSSHEVLAECLARCVNDVYGDVDHKEAKAMMAGLRVEPTNIFMRYLRKNL